MIKGSHDSIKPCPICGAGVRIEQIDPHARGDWYFACEKVGCCYESYGHGNEECCIINHNANRNPLYEQECEKVEAMRENLRKFARKLIGVYYTALNGKVVHDAGVMLGKLIDEYDTKED